MAKARSATRRCSSSSGRRRSSATRPRPRRPASTGVMAADHFQPWVPQQGQAAFVWNVLTALGERTKGDIGPGVTCPSFRFHPAIVAQAAATLEHMYPGRTWLGLGSRRGAQRAHRRRLLARDARADRADVRGDRDHPQAVPAPRPGRQARRQVLQARVDAPLDAARPDAADLHRDRGPRHGQEDRHVRGRPDHRRRARREDRHDHGEVPRGLRRGRQGSRRASGSSSSSTSRGRPPTKRR